MNSSDFNYIRATNAVRVNAIVNDPSIYPWIKGNHTGPLDLSRVVDNRNNVVLVGNYGCMIFIKHQIGLYEFHSSVLPEGRGPWVERAAEIAFHYMFTKTDAYELLTKCPDNNLLTKLAARRTGLSFQFRTAPVWPTGNGLVPVDIYSMIIQNWVIKAPGLEDRGHWFHETLITQYSKLGRDIDVVADDLTHDRYVGAAIDMIDGGQIMKAVNFYNRWAIMASYKPISVISREPLILDIFEAKIRITDNNFEVI